jgi:integrase
VRAVKHREAVPYAEIAHFMGELRLKDGVSARALEFTILTAVRTGETIGARWAEIDLDARLWTIPAGRIKLGANIVFRSPTEPSKSFRVCREKMSSSSSDPAPIDR